MNRSSVLLTSEELSGAGRLKQEQPQGPWDVGLNHRLLD